MISRIDRRALILAAAGAALTRPVEAAPKLADDGMYYFDWYLESFLDFARAHGAEQNHPVEFVVAHSRCLPFGHQIVFERQPHRTCLSTSSPCTQLLLIKKTTRAGNIRGT